VHAVLAATVRQGLEGQVGQGPEVVGDGGGRLAQGRDRPLPLGRIGHPAQGQPQDRLAVVLGGGPAPGRGQAGEQHHAQLGGRLGADVAQHAEHLGGVFQGPEDRPAQQDRADRVEPVLEGGGDPDVAAAAPQPPVQLRLGPGVDVEGLALGGDQVDRAQVVDGQAELAHGVAETAAEGEATDPGVWLTIPDGVASPNRWVARSSSPSRTPPAAHPRASERNSSSRVGVTTSAAARTASNGPCWLRPSCSSTIWAAPASDMPAPRSALRTPSAGNCT
jgi:hypothetical protein